MVLVFIKIICFLQAVCYITSTDRSVFQTQHSAREGIVGEKQFLTFLGTSFVDRIRCVFETHKGKVVKINVVQYETLVKDEWLPVVRYDTAHGFFHRDVYLFGGHKHFKEFIFRPNLKEALTYAIQDIRINWEKYKSAYLEKGNGQEKS
jgi:hypothetical protein